MTEATVFAALAAVVVAGVAPTITLAVYLGGRVDRLADRVRDLELAVHAHAGDPRAHERSA